MKVAIPNFEDNIGAKGYLLGLSNITRKSILYIFISYDEIQDADIVCT